MDKPVIDPEWHALTAMQRDVCVVLAVAGPATGKDVWRGLGGAEITTPESTYRTLAQLREQGYAERERGEDGREWLNRLSDRGKDVTVLGVRRVADRMGGGQ